MNYHIQKFKREIIPTGFVPPCIGWEVIDLLNEVCNEFDLECKEPEYELGEIESEPQYVLCKWAYPNNIIVYIGKQAKPPYTWKHYLKIIEDMDNEVPNPHV